MTIMHFSLMELRSVEYPFQELLLERRLRAELHIENEPLLWTHGASIDRELHAAAESVRSLRRRIERFEMITFDRHD